jgi:hypothetical protein
MEIDDREFAKTLQGGWICEPDPCKVRDARSCSCSRAAATINRLLDKLDTLREALDCLLPGLVLDLRYAEPDDDTDAMRSRIKTVTDALEATK